MIMIKKFEEYIEEDFNFTISDIGDISFEDRWFYYEPDDDIIYGSDDKPVDKKYLFYFNPKSCLVVVDGKEVQYDVNNPTCLISYELDNDEIKIYTEDVYEYLKILGITGDIENNIVRKRIHEIFNDKDDEYRFLLLKGNKLISSTFDIIEEN